MVGVSDKCSVDDSQANMVGVNLDLADPGADDASPALMVIAQTPPTDNLSRVGSYRSDDIPQLEHDFLQGQRCVLKKRFDLARR